MGLAAFTRRFRRVETLRGGPLRAALRALLAEDYEAAAVELKNAYSAVSGAKPIEKESEHYFFKLGDFEPFLRDWVNSDDHVQEHMIHKLNEWFESGLKNWDISRDAPYWGFEIPDAPGKYFYVWLRPAIPLVLESRDLRAMRAIALDFEDHIQLGAVFKFD